MKKIYLLFFALFFANLIFSQDLITLKNGDEIKSKVIELTKSEIKYKKFSNLDGPIYNISKSKVFMIKYENGEKDVFEINENEIVKNDTSLRIDFTGFGSKFWYGENKISKSEFNSIIIKNTEAENLYKLGNNLRTTSLIIGIPSGFVFGWQIGSLAGGDDVNSAALTISGIGFVGSIILDYMGRDKMRKSVNIYNKSSNSLSLIPIINNNGIGIAILLN